MPHLNHLCRYRKQFALTQKEVARFLGVDDTTVSRVEAGASPSAEFALGCQLLFGQAPSVFFPKLAESVRSAVLARLATFSIQIDQEAGDAADARQQFLHAIAVREDYEFIGPAI